MTFKQSEHDKKFDRQMRLWGAHGQINLENANLCVLGSGALASETLKNLVLPNVGNFTIIDDVKVSDSDLGNNFFVTQDDLGKYRAETVTKWLLEMNPDVKGKSINKSYIDIIKNDIKLFKNYSFIISTNLYGKLDIELGNYCYKNNIPYISLKINGLLGKMRLQFDELCIMESHPTNDRTDLCLYPDRIKLFKELYDYCKSFDINTKDVEKKAHLPAVALLVQYTENWIKQHKKLPDTYKDKEKFKDGLSKLGQSENFEDAVQFASQCYLKPKIYPDVLNVLNNEKAKKLTSNSNIFWILVKSLNDFRLKNGGYLPVSTNIPDMTMDTKSYVILKKIYKQKFENDLKLIKSFIIKNLEQLKLKKDYINDELINRFVRNCRSLKVVNSKSINDEYTKPNLEEINEMFIDPMAMFAEADDENKDKNEDDDEDEEEELLNPLPIHWYLGYRSVELYYDKYNKLPGSDNNNKNLENDLKNLIECQNNLMKTLKLDTKTLIKPCLSEFVRFGGSQIHNIAASIGGMAASTIMKCILKQFFPFNDTYIYNGIHCSGAVFKI